MHSVQVFAAREILFENISHVHTYRRHSLKSAEILILLNSIDRRVQFLKGEIDASTVTTEIFSSLRS